jgi:hypothetical protein
MKYVHQDSGGGRKIIKKYDVNKRPNITNQNFFVDAKAWVRKKKYYKSVQRNTFWFWKEDLPWRRFRFHHDVSGFRRRSLTFKP